MNDVIKKLIQTIAEKTGVEFSDEEQKELETQFNEKLEEIADKKVEKDEVKDEEVPDEPSTTGDETEGSDDTISTKLEEERKKCLAKTAEMLKEAETTHEKEIEDLDNEATDSIEQVADEIDQAACDEIVKLIDELDAAACEEIEKIKAAYEAKIAELDDEASDAIEQVAEKVKDEAITESLIDKISTFLDMEIEKMAPIKNELDIVKLSRLEKMTESLRELLFVNDDYIQHEIVEAVEDAAKIIREKDSKINKVLNESLEYRKKLDMKESHFILESKTKNLPPKMRAFVESYCKNSSISKLEGKINEAVEAWNLDEKETRKREKPESNLRPIVEEVERKDNGKQTRSIISSYADVLKKYTEQ